MIVVFGQEDYSIRLKNYLSVLLPNEKISLIMIPLEYDQPDKTVFSFDEYIKKLNRYTDAKIYVAIAQKFHCQLKNLLNKAGFSKLIFYNAALDNRLKKDFFKKYFSIRRIDFFLLEELNSICLRNDTSVLVYMARCVVDKPIKGYTDKLSRYIIPIQVGKELTDKKIADVTDDTGDNISSRNRRYSEMTAFYWMWKNAKADYLGICHYRRLWVDLDGIVRKIRTTDVDAVLPLPTLCEHSVYEDYLLKHIPDVWRPMMDVLREQSPDYYEASKEIFKGRIFYASNMCILKRNVLDDLCSWMFPIVMEVERRVGDLPDTYYNRYAGFCTERLITLYFLYNKNNWKIAHAEKVFIG